MKDLDSPSTIRRRKGKQGLREKYNEYKGGETKQKKGSEWEILQPQRVDDFPQGRTPGNKGGGDITRIDSAELGMSYDSSYTTKDSFGVEINFKATLWIQDLEDQREPECAEIEPKTREPRAGKISSTNQLGRKGPQGFQRRS